MEEMVYMQVGSLAMPLHPLPSPAAGEQHASEPACWAPSATPCSGHLICASDVGVYTAFLQLVSTPCFVTSWILLANRQHFANPALCIIAEVLLIVMLSLYILFVKWTRSTAKPLMLPATMLLDAHRHVHGWWPMMSAHAHNAAGIITHGQGRTGRLLARMPHW